LSRNIETQRTRVDIFDFAHRYGVPYFKDTTPHWSTRGKLRNSLLPLLDEMYGDGFLNHLSALATESAQLSELAVHSLFEPFWAR
jgi:tRNA(Ile)-lysidine synthase TilS/MesJ